MESDYPRYEGARPLIEIATDVGSVALTWDNSLLRLFRPPFQEYSHLEYTDDEGTIYGFNVTARQAELLCGMSFPCLIEPEIDEPTYEWYVGSISQELNEIETWGENGTH